LTQPDFERAKQYALERLTRDLSPDYHYHSLWHTQEDVVPAAERLAEKEGITGESLLLLRTAAWFHDVGCIVQRAEHEAIGVGIVLTVLPGLGYSRDQLRIIQGMIMATRLPQTPHTLLDQILADADLDALGREDFVARNTALRAELAAFGVFWTDQDWRENQINFLREHHYFTAVARSLRQAQKQLNLEALLKKEAEGEAGPEKVKALTPQSPFQ